MGNDKKNDIPDAVKTAGLLSIGWLLGRGLRKSSGTSSSNKRGCLGCLGILLLIGLFGLILERIGCLATDKSLREKVNVVITDIQMQEDKNLAWVYFKVKNDSKWPVSLCIEVELFQTTKDYPTVINSVDVLGVPPNSESDEKRVAFDLKELAEAGIGDLTDKDRCSIVTKIEWITEAGDEPKDQTR